MAVVLNQIQIEDATEIKRITDLILKNRKNINATITREFKNTNIQNIGYTDGRKSANELDIENRKKGAYCWYSRSHLDIALNEFFSDYACKWAAKNCYYLDEGDIFSETVSFDYPLGRTVDKGVAVETSTATFSFLVLPYGKVDKGTGLPFKIHTCELVPDEED